MAVNDQGVKNETHRTPKVAQIFLWSESSQDLLLAIAEDPGAVSLSKEGFISGLEPVACFAT